MLEYVVLGILATWRISVALVYDDVFMELRETAGVGMEDESGNPVSFGAWALGCFWCCTLPTAFGVSTILALCYMLETQIYPWSLVMWPFAMSGGSILVHYWCRVHLVLGGGNG